MQSLIRNELQIKKGSLDKEIDEAITVAKYPSNISDLLHALRSVGNFAAHPEKDTNTGSIIDVDVEEAELCLDVLEALFDFHFVTPAKNAAKLALHNQKRIAANKPPI